MGFIEKENKVFAKILSDGSLRVQAKQGDPNAEKRVVEMPDKSTKEYYELVKRGIKGKIEKIDFKEMEFGKVINITFAKEDDSSEQICLSMNSSSNFATDFMEKLPNIDLTKELSLSPWSMTNEKGKTRKGIVVWQDGEKINSFFKEYKEGKAPKSINGFPTVTAAEVKKYDKDDWKMYFTNIKKFLVKYTEENIIPNIKVEERVETEVGNFEEEESNSPFES